MSDTNSDSKKVNIHEARLRVLLQNLEDHAEIKIPLDRTYRKVSTTYGDTENCKYSLKEFLKVVWKTPEDEPYGATENAVKEYFEDFSYRSDEPTKYLREDHKESIKRIKLAYFHKDHPNNKKDIARENFYFKGDNRQAGYASKVLPKEEIRLEKFLKFDFLRYFSEETRNTWIENIESYMKKGVHRNKNLLNKILTYLKEESTTEELHIIEEKLIKVVQKHIEKVRSKQKHGLKLLPDYEHYYLLSRLNYKLYDDDREEIESRGFSHAFADSENPFDGLRYQTIDYWQGKLKKEDVRNWPGGFLEHILLASIEFIAACRIIGFKTIGARADIGCGIFYSSNGYTINRIKSESEISKLWEILKDYDLDFSALVDQVKSDGNLLTKPLARLPLNIRENKQMWTTSFKNALDSKILFYIKKKICEYISFDYDKRCIKELLDQPYGRY